MYQYIQGTLFSSSYFYYNDDFSQPIEALFCSFNSNNLSLYRDILGGCVTKHRSVKVCPVVLCHAHHDSIGRLALFQNVFMYMESFRSKHSNTSKLEQKRRSFVGNSKH